MSSIDVCYDVFKALEKELTAFQRELHYPENVELGDQHPGNKVRSEFLAEYRKSTWFMHKPERMVSEIAVTSTESDHPIVRFKAAHRCHGLIYSDFCQPLPEIICKEGYEAHWVPNVGTNVIVSCTLKIDTTRLQCFDTTWLDMYANSLIDECDVAAYNENVGNIPELQEWSPVLPKYDCSVPLPWFYNRGFSDYFPMYYCGSLNEVVHEIKFRNRLDALLHVRKVSDPDSIVPLVEAISTVNGIPFNVDSPFMPATSCRPEMWGEYLYLTDIECVFNRCITMPLDMLPRRNTIYYHDVVAFDSRSKHNLRDVSVEVRISHPDPIHMIGWVCRNVKAEASKHYGTYTTGAGSGLGAGASPIRNSTLQINENVTSKIFERLPSWRTNRVYPLKHLACKPRSKGFNFWFMGAKSSSLNLQPGIIFHEGCLTIEPEDTNPYIGANPAVKPNTDTEFHLQVRALVTKKFSFAAFPTTDAERHAMKTRIVPHKVYE